MHSLSEIHARLEAKRKERRELMKSFRDELANNAEYVALAGQLQTLREKKKGIEQVAMTQALGAAEKIDVLKLDIKSDIEMLSDMALTKLAKQEPIEIVEGDSRWLPVFSVRFKKEEGAPAAVPALEPAPTVAPEIFTSFADGAMPA